VTSLREALRSVRDQPLHSLASRVVALVTASTLLSALAVTWLATRSIRGELRERSEQRISLLLQSAAARVEIWHAERELEIASYARSVPLDASLAAWEGAADSARDRAREQTRSLLEELLARSPQYESLIASDTRADLVAYAGPAPSGPIDPLTQVSLRERPDLASSDARPLGLVSAPVLGRDGIVVGTLHGVARVGELERELRTDALLASGRLFLVVHGRGGAGADGTRAQPGGLELLEAGEQPRVVEARSEDGRRVLRGTIRSDRLAAAIVVEESVRDGAGELAVLRQMLGINLLAVLVASALAFAIALCIARPIQALSSGALRIARGELEVEIPEMRGSCELRLLTQTMNRIAARLRKNRIELHDSRTKLEQANARLRAQNEELQRQSEALELLSITDGLTRLYNHRYFQEQLSREIARCERSGEPLALILLDIDNFKQLNDKYGHSAGDAVLREVARRMNGLIREGDVLARYGGEEFALIPSRSTADGAFGLAEKLRLAVSSAEIALETPEGLARIRVTLSAGIAIYRGDRRSFFIEADRALYRAKASGKDCVVME
jgi:diguanylate cyclase (GGDEF)-like protein